MGLPTILVRNPIFSTELPNLDSPKLIALYNSNKLGPMMFRFHTKEMVISQGLAIRHPGISIGVVLKISSSRVPGGQNEMVGEMKPRSSTQGKVSLERNISSSQSAGRLPL
jgi:hypothetical protein